ncbi:hypothetical protein OIV83_003356 [Microbotryomycetes sp. JL201]|nr:hypothetical protein OIV83_003356 [Microbotryomycetes sp. JL201]
MSQTRFTQRLSPVSFTCHASSEDKIREMSTELIRHTFRDWIKRHGRTHVTYQIDPQLRNHVAPLTRDVLFELLGSIVRELPDNLKSEEAAAGQAEQVSQNLQSVAANLKHPDLVLLPTVLKSVYGLSVVDGALWKDRKFNLDVLASDARKRLQFADGE